jgi:alanyl-tRNA synthetase
MLNNAPNLAQTMQKVFDENQELKKSVEEFKKEKIAQIKHELEKQIKDINGIKTLILRAPFSADMIKNIALQMRGEHPEKFMFIASSDHDSKPSITLMLSDDLVKDGLDAAKIIRSAAKHIRGGGGGQAHFATAGGKNVDGLIAAVDEILNLIETENKNP